MNFLGGILMLGVKILIYSSIFLVCSIIGLLKSQKYVYRVEELQEFKNALNMFKTKIKFTYEPIPDIFSQISGSINPSVGSIFKIASYNMKFFPAGDAWNKAIDTFQDGSYSKYSSCGHTIRRDWRYCPYCGAKVKVIDDLNE